MSHKVGTHAAVIGMVICNVKPVLVDRCVLEQNVLVEQKQKIPQTGPFNPHISTAALQVGIDCAFGNLGNGYAKKFKVVINFYFRFWVLVLNIGLHNRAGRDCRCSRGVSEQSELGRLSADMVRRCVMR